MAESGDPPWTPSEPTRRLAKGAGGRELMLKALEFARENDEAGFAEMLHCFDVWEGTEEFEERMAIFHDVCREVRLRGR